MSNNRKRNMKKLARNIITGTALAVGGLTQTSAHETNRAETQTENSGGMNAGTIAGLVTSTLIGGGSIVAGAMQYKGNKELTQKGQDEASRHNKVEEDRAAAKDREEQAARKVGATTSQVSNIITNLNNIRRKRKLEGVDESVVTTILNRGKSAAKVLLAGKNGTTDADETQIFKALRDEIKINSNRNKLIGEAIDKLANGPVTKNSVNSWVALTGKHGGGGLNAHQVKVADHTLNPQASAPGAFINLITASAGAEASTVAKYDETSYAAGDCLLSGDLKNLLGGCVPVGWASLTPSMDGNGAWLGQDHRGKRDQQRARLTLGDPTANYGQQALPGPYLTSRNGNGMGCLILGRDIANPGAGAEVFGFDNDETSGTLNANTRAKLNRMIGQRTIAAINFKEVPDEKEDENGDW